MCVSWAATTEVKWIWESTSSSEHPHSRIVLLSLLPPKPGPVKASSPLAWSLPPVMPRRYHVFKIFVVDILSPANAEKQASYGWRNAPGRQDCHHCERRLIPPVFFQHHQAFQ